MTKRGGRLLFRLVLILDYPPVELRFPQEEMRDPNLRMKMEVTPLFRVGERNQRGRFGSREETKDKLRQRKSPA